jgi:NADPH-dependent 2,4-dienoyl-CoA reductase/sulfur reductase-like enzyme
MKVRYCIVGGGAAAAAAIEGIRAHDPDGSILMLSRENHRPYRRPLLTKDLWYGTATLDRLPLHPDEWYAEQRVEIRLRTEVIEVDAEGQRLWDERGQVFSTSSCCSLRAAVRAACAPRAPRPRAFATSATSRTTWTSSHASIACST